jgi:hypothetical protein
MTESLILENLTKEKSCQKIRSKQKNTFHGEGQHSYCSNDDLQQQMLLGKF